MRKKRGELKKKAVRDYRKNTKQELEVDRLGAPMLVIKWHVTIQWDKGGFVARDKSCLKERTGRREKANQERITSGIKEGL